MSWLNKTHVGDCRELLTKMAADGVRVQTCVTSPPYFGLRDYGHAGQIGLELTPAEYVSELVTVFRCVRDVLANDGTVWLNLGDSYAGSGRGGDTGKSGLQGTTTSQDESKKGRAAQRGSQLAAGLHENQRQAGQIGRAWVPAPAGFKQKDLLGIPWRVAFALQGDGWYLRSDIIWSKPNCMPESVTDRPTKSHEYLFLLAKSERYYFDQEAIKEPADPANFRTSDPAARWVPEGQTPHTGFRNGRQYETRNKRTVWTVPPAQFAGAHFATFPPDLITPCILAGAAAGQTVLDPFMGSGTTAQVATDLGRQFIGCELNQAYVDLHHLRRTTVGMAF
jgi:DNA modification methylase